MTPTGIRPARPGDLPAVAGPRWARESRGAVPTAPEGFAPRCSAWVGENRAAHRCTVAVRGGRVVGTAWSAHPARRARVQRARGSAHPAQCTLFWAPSSPSSSSASTASAVRSSSKASSLRSTAEKSRST